MYDLFLNNMTDWINSYPVLALLLCLLWGTFTVLMSPCHLATVSLMAMPDIANSPVKRKIPLFMFGHILSLFAVGSLLAIFSYQLDLLGHYWTIPFGLLFVYLAWFFTGTHSCSHGHSHDNTHSHGVHSQGLITKATRLISKNSFGFMSFGLVYGFLSSGCILAFLAPILFLAQDQSLTYALTLNLMFAIGHTLPLFLTTKLAFALHRLLYHGTAVLKVFRYSIVLIFFLLGTLLALYPFLELMGFDVHLHYHSDQYDCGHDHSSHNHVHTEGCEDEDMHTESHEHIHTEDCEHEHVHTEHHEHRK